MYAPKEAVFSSPSGSNHNNRNHLGGFRKGPRPFEFSPGAATANTPLGNRVPVVLVHGAGSDARENTLNYWYWWCNEYFNAAQYSSKFKVFRYVYDSSRHISANGSDFAQFVTGYPEFNGRQVVIMAHSMGGLVARHALNTSSPLRDMTLKLVTLGTPHLGSPGANPTWAYHTLGGSAALQAFMSIIHAANFGGSEGDFDLAWHDPSEIPTSAWSPTSAIIALARYDDALVLASLNSPFTGSATMTSQLADSKVVAFGGYRTSTSELQGWGNDPGTPADVREEVESDHFWLPVAEQAMGSMKKRDASSVGSNDGLVPLESALLQTHPAVEKINITDAYGIELDHSSYLDQKSVMDIVMARLLDVIPPPPAVQFATALSSVQEGNVAHIEVTLSHGTSQQVTVPFTLGGSATEGVDWDYTVSPQGQLIFAPQQTSQTITVTVNDDPDVEGDETVILTLGTPTNADLGTPSSHELTIGDVPPQAPDLVVSYLEPPTITVPFGDTFHVDSRVLNQGTAYAGMSTLGWYKAPSATTPKGDRQHFADDTIGGQAVGSDSLTISRPVIADASFGQPGQTVYIFTQADRLNVVPEGTAGESNNWSDDNLTPGYVVVTIPPEPEGSLQVTLEPVGAVSAGAQWRVDVGAWQDSGATVTDLSPGNHTVSYKLTVGWDEPSPEDVLIVAGQTTTLTGTYIQEGNLQVFLQPAGAVSAGAQWQVDGGTWFGSGTTLGGLSPGTHTVSYKTITGWTAPSPENVLITAGQTTTYTSGWYVPVSPVTGTHISAGYEPGGTATVTCRIEFQGTPSALGWSADIPAGWSYVSGTDEPGVKPTPSQTGTLEWAWTTMPASPVEFTYALSVPPGEDGDKTISATVIYREAGQLYQVAATDDPLVVPKVYPHHSADTNRDWKIGLIELTRVIELYNYRDGTVRTGEYHVQDGTEDGYATGPGSHDGRPHSADTIQDWRLGLIELTRVIELYNYRDGTVRTGEYHVEAGTEDGYAAGPAGARQAQAAGVDSAVLLVQRAPLTRSLILATVTATHSAAPQAYPAGGGQITIASTITFDGQPSALAWSADIPAGWSYASGTGEPGVTPFPGQTGTLEWAWTSMPPSPVQFTYTLNVPSGQTGDKSIPATAIYRESGQLQQIPAGPDPLVTPSDATGSLQVTLQPSGAVAAGAQWRVDGGAWQDSGATVSGLSAGTHSVSYKGISGWTASLPESVDIVASETATLTGTYTPSQAPVLALVETADSSYVRPGETVTVKMNVSGLAPREVNSVQALLEYDDTRLVAPKAVDKSSQGPWSAGLPIGPAYTGNQIDYALGLISDHTSSDAEIAVLTFTASTPDGPAYVRFRPDDPPEYTKFVTWPDLQNLLPDKQDAGPIIVDGTAPVVTVTSPTGNDRVPGGGSWDIIWSTNDANPDTVKIEYSVNGPTGPWTTLVGSTSDDGAHEWSPCPEVNADDCFVRVTATDKAGNEGVGTSEQFPITKFGVEVQSPNGGEYLQGSSTHNITWTTTGGSAPVTAAIEYSNNGATGSWHPIATNIPDTGSHLWNPVAPANSGSCRVRVTLEDATATSVSDISDGDFTIDSTRPDIAIVSVKQGGVELLGGPPGKRGQVDIQVMASDALSGLAAPPSVTLTFSDSSSAPAMFVDETPVGTYNYTYNLTSGTPSGVCTVDASVVDRAGNDAAADPQAFTINVRVLNAIVELEGYIGSPGALLTLRFAFTNPAGTVLGRLDVDVPYTNGRNKEAVPPIELVPLGATHVSCKEIAHFLRRRIAIGGAGAVLTADFTGDSKLLGGDIAPTPPDEHDNFVELTDFARFLRDFGRPDRPGTDINGDGVVDITDFGYIAAHFLTGGDPE